MVAVVLFETPVCTEQTKPVCLIVFTKVKVEHGKGESLSQTIPYFKICLFCVKHNENRSYVSHFIYILVLIITWCMISADFSVNSHNIPNQSTYQISGGCDHPCWKYYAAGYYMPTSLCKMSDLR